ncbi:MAG: hypothetical protein LKK39_05185 [Oscillospiraceae bacterium]|jgi:hypothetical protein|nr:hypothetical protein [Oscillospiraceae bacterium]MCI2191693.1 hypothetical protein [Oscillospiraceae bacterium]MCI2205660.1 hypothetical protein [Oscillospiraceae bacterium]
MIFYTTSAKTIICPYWGKSVTLIGRYRLHQCAENDNIGTFMDASCPIIENSKMPYGKQKDDFKLMRCPYKFGCKFMLEFKGTVDFQKEGYSQ